MSAFNSTLYYLCGFAVPVFLMASGYFLMNKTHVSVQYSLQKICRIMRVVVLWNLLYQIAKISQSLLLQEKGNNWIIEFLKGIFGGLVQKDPFWQFWYFGALILLYIMLPVLSCIPKKHRIKIVLLLSGIMFAFYFFSVIRGAPLQKNIIQSFRLWTWIFYFMLGGLLRDYEKQWKEKVTFRQNIILLSIFTIIVLVYQNLMGRFVIHEYTQSSNILHAEYFYDSIIMICWVVIIFMTFTRLNFRTHITDVISKMTELTMGIYIVHPFVMRLFQRVILPDTLLMSLFFFVMVFISSAVIVWCINKLPFGKYMTQL